MRTAVFWDIDGTLVNTGGIGAPILESAVEEITRRKSLIDKKLMSGFTDYEIVRQLSENSSTVISKKDIEKVLHIYIDKIKDLYQLKPPRVNRNIKRVLENLELNSNVSNFIASGNCKEGGSIKLSNAGIDSFFSLDQSFYANLERQTRMEIISDVKKFSNNYDKSFIIGDSPKDIICANEYDLPVIAIDSGQHSANELKQFKPTFLLSGLWSFDDLLKILK